MKPRAEYEHLKEEAIQHAKKNYHAVAVIYSNDGERFDIGSHGEPRYIASCKPFCDATFMIICSEHTNNQWRMVLPINEVGNHYPFGPLD